MDILVVRHGESEADILNVHEGRADFNLTPRGERQAQAMAACLSAKCNFVRIYSSTLKRAAQTAQALSDAANVEITYDVGLMEFNNGLLAGLAFDEADRLYPCIEGLPIHESRYEMESALDFRMRAERFISKLLNENSLNDTVAVISHGGMIRELYKAFLGLPVNSNVSFATGDTGIHQWRFDGENRIVIFANSTSHCSEI